MWDLIIQGADEVIQGTSPPRLIPIFKSCIVGTPYSGCQVPGSTFEFPHKTLEHGRALHLFRHDAKNVVIFCFSVPVFLALEPVDPSFLCIKIFRERRHVPDLHHILKFNNSVYTFC